MEPLRQLRSDDVSEFLRAAAVSARAHAPGIDHLDHLDPLDGIEGGNDGSNVAATLEALVTLLTAGAKDLTHANSIAYDPNDGCVVMSFRNQDVVGKIERTPTARGDRPSTPVQMIKVTIAGV